MRRSSSAASDASGDSSPIKNPLKSKRAADFAKVRISVVIARYSVVGQERQETPKKD
jgi:hypothetical protein